MSDPMQYGIPLVLDLSFADGDIVYTSVDRAAPAIANALSLVISNPSSKPLVPHDVDWGPRPPSFTISLVFAEPPGYGALTTPELGADIRAHLVERHGDRWTLSPGHPPWVLTPIKATNHEVLGVGVHASVMVDITDIVSQLPLGDDPDTTSLYVAHAHVPGYANGSSSVPISKLPGPSITQFYADPASVPFGKTEGHTKLYWATEHALTVSLDPGGAEPARGSLPHPIDVTVGDRFTLTAVVNPSIHVEHAIEIASVERSSATLPAFIGDPFVLPTDAGATYVIGRSVVPPCFAVTASGAVTVVSLPAGGGPPSPSTAAAACTDGTTIYLLMSGQPGVTPVDLVTIDAATHVARTATQVMASSPPLGPFAALSANGKWLCCGRWDVVGGSMEMTVTVMDTRSWQTVASTTLLNATPPGLQRASTWSWTAGLSNDGAVVYLVGLQGVSAFETATGLPVAWLDYEERLGTGYATWADAMSPPGKRAYVVAQQTGSQAWMLALDLHPTSQTLEIVDKRVVQGSDSFPLALSADGTELFVARPDELLVVDTDEFTQRTFSCGADDFNPKVIALGKPADVVYSTAGGDLTTTTIVGL